MNDAGNYHAVNKDVWEHQSDAYQDRHGALLEAHEGQAWGVWRIPEAHLQVLGDVEGRHVLELGCGAARWSISLARGGAKPVGLDISTRQLAHARQAMAAAGVRLALVRASAEHVPFADESFDIVFADHGGFSVADPARVIQEAARLLRRDGLLAFSTVSPLLDLIDDVNDEARNRFLARNYFTLSIVKRHGLVGFHMMYGTWIRLFRTNGFEILDLIEIRPREDATTTFDLVPRDWARQWPAEIVWKARRQR
jgi:ubiquinone/menaquinone biosynthesis C-methylase UbiE